MDLIRPARPSKNFIASAQATKGSERGVTVRAVVKDVARAIACAEKNVQSLLDYAQSLLHAKGLNEVMRPARRIRSMPNAVTDRAGERNGPDRKPGGHGGGQAKNGQ